MKCLILFAATVSAITAGKMLGNQTSDGFGANLRNLEATDAKELQRFKDQQEIELERARAEDERLVRVATERMRAMPEYAEWHRINAKLQEAKQRPTSPANASQATGMGQITPRNRIRETSQ